MKYHIPQPSYPILEPTPTRLVGANQPIPNPHSLLVTYNPASKERVYCTCWFALPHLPPLPPTTRRYVIHNNSELIPAYYTFYFEIVWITLNLSISYSKINIDHNASRCVFVEHL